MHDSRVSEYPSLSLLAAAAVVAPLAHASIVAYENREVLEKRKTSKPGQGIVIFRDHLRNQHGQTVYEIDKTPLIETRAVPG